MATHPLRGPDADKKPPSIADFHKAMADVPVTPTDFNEITVHPLELERIMAVRNAAPEPKPLPETVPQDHEELAANITAENAVIAATTFPKEMQFGEYTVVVTSEDHLRQVEKFFADGGKPEIAADSKESV